MPIDLFGSQTTTTTPNSTSFPGGLFGQTVTNLQNMGDPYQMSAPQWSALGNLLTATTAPRPDPVTGNPAWQGFLANQQGLQGYQQGFTPPSAMGGSASFSPSASSYGGVGVMSQPGVTTAQIDPANAEASAAQALSKFAMPQVQAAMQAAGMGRSGATGEAIANAGASLQLPISMAQLQSQAQANQLDAQIKAMQGQTTALYNLQAQLQGQMLSAKSQSEANAIGAQLAAVNAQLSTQASIANTNASANIYGTNVGAGTAMGGQLASLAAQFPQIFNQNYLSGITGAQAGLQAASFPQSLDIANQTAQQGFLTRLLGTQQPGGTQTVTNNPGALGLGALGAMGLGLLPAGTLPALGGAISTGAGSLMDLLTGANTGQTGLQAISNMGDFMTSPLPDLTGTDWLT